MKDAVKYGQADEPPLLEGEKVQESTCKYYTIGLVFAQL